MQNPIDGIYSSSSADIHARNKRAVILVIKGDETE